MKKSRLLGAVFGVVIAIACTAAQSAVLEYQRTVNQGWAFETAVGANYPVKVFPEDGWGFSLFDSTLGELNSVEIELSATSAYWSLISQKLVDLSLPVSGSYSFHQFFSLTLNQQGLPSMNLVSPNASIDASFNLFSGEKRTAPINGPLHNFSVTKTFTGNEADMFSRIGDAYSTFTLGFNHVLDSITTTDANLLIASSNVGYGGIQYTSGGIVEFSVKYTYSAVPIPPALWLFGSGLLGLVGVARKKAA